MNRGVVSLDTHRRKKDGTCPIIMRLGHNEKTTSITVGISIDQKDWDEKKRLIKNSYKGIGSVARLNNQIQKTKADEMDIIRIGIVLQSLSSPKNK